jgi:hypothetical protein
MNVSDSGEDGDKLVEVLREGGNTRLIIRSILLRIFEEANCQTEQTIQAIQSGWTRGRKKMNHCSSDEFQWVQFLNVLSQTDIELLPLLLEELVSWLKVDGVAPKPVPSGWITSFQIFMDLYVAAHL